MKPKIVIADDSQTTQKVVKIYISKLEEDPSLNFECELIECLEESELENVLTEHKPALVLLDFNFSENKTGYDLATEIKNHSQSKVLMLYGTFDKVDESLFQEAGVNSYVVKPFDGAKFLTQLQDLLEESKLEDSDETVQEELDDVVDEAILEPVLEEIPEEEVHFEQDSEEASVEIEDEVIVEEEEELVEDDYVSESIVAVTEEKSHHVEIDDDWVVQQPTVEEEVELKTEEVVSHEEMNSLEAGMADWGTGLPPVIGEDNPVKMEIPPVIEGDSIDFDSEEKYPSDDDLAYPDEIQAFETEEINDEIESEEKLNELEEVEENEADGLRSMLTPMSELAEEPAEDYDYKEIGIDQTSGTNTIEEVRALEQQIADEVDITSTHQLADIWGTDEVQEPENEESTVEHDNESTISEDTSDTIEFQSSEAVEEELVAEVEISEEEIKAKVEEMLAPMVEKLVKDRVDTILEKVSWEVLPDLAENLIRKELKDITDHVLNSDGA